MVPHAVQGRSGKRLLGAAACARVALQRPTGRAPRPFASALPLSTAAGTSYGSVWPLLLQPRPPQWRRRQRQQRGHDPAAARACCTEGWSPPPRLPQPLAAGGPSRPQEWAGEQVPKGGKRLRHLRKRSLSSSSGA